MNLSLVTLDGVKFSEDAYSITLPTAAGEITVFPDHEPLVSVLVPGVVTVRRTKNDPNQMLEHFATYGGVVEIGGNMVRVLVDEAEGGDITEQEVEKAKAEAEKLKREAKSQVELEQAQALIDRQAVRLQVAQLRRRNQRR